MRLLMLGGTQFLGRAMVEAALARHHEVTLFNRGRTAPALFPNLEKRVGDRDGGLGALDEGRWDVVLDPSGYIPRVVEQSAQKLAARCDHYVFISSISVYPITSNAVGPDEEAPTLDPDWESSEVTGESYGPMKVACEEVVRRLFADRSLSVRAGLLVGPHDPTGRFSYWPDRYAAGGEILMPERPTLPIQCIDVRDIAAWVIGAAEARVSGPINVTAPPGSQSMGSLDAACRAATSHSAPTTFVPEPLLLQEGVRPWVDLPLWLTSDANSMRSAPVDRALATGLAIRSLEETTRDTLTWERQRAASGRGTPPTGLARDREAAILARWDGVRE